MSKASCDFVAKKDNVILVGQSETCKTHLAIAQARKACEAGYHVRFTTIQYLAAALRGALADETFEQRLGEFVEPHQGPFRLARNPPPFYNYSPPGTCDTRTCSLSGRICSAPHSL